MTNLTDKWHKGELPSGWYWVKGARAEGIYAYTSEYLNNIDRPAEGEKIVEKVPSFEEWEQLQNWVDFTNDYHGLREKLEIAEYENTKLKELLRELKRYFDKDGKYYIEKRILLEINRVLGE